MCVCACVLCFERVSSSILGAARDLYCFYCDCLRRGWGLEGNFLAPPPAHMEISVQGHFLARKFQCREIPLHSPLFPCMEISVQGNFLATRHGNFTARVGGKSPSKGVGRKFLGLSSRISQPLAAFITCTEISLRAGIHAHTHAFSDAPAHANFNARKFPSKGLGRP